MISITDLAVKKLKQLLADESPQTSLRVYVKGGGCSGYSYGMVFESMASEDDTSMVIGDVPVLIDPQSLGLLTGCEIDYTDGLNGSGFGIKNPNAKTTCGCGSSFSV